MSVLLEEALNGNSDLVWTEVDSSLCVIQDLWSLCDLQPWTIQHDPVCFSPEGKSSCGEANIQKLHLPMHHHG